MTGRNELIAQACVERIRKYWESRGHKVKVTYGHESEHSGALYPITSDMRNGLPKGARG